MGDMGRQIRCDAEVAVKSFFLSFFGIVRPIGRRNTTGDKTTTAAAAAAAAAAGDAMCTCELLILYACARPCWRVLFFFFFLLSSSCHRRAESEKRRASARLSIGDDGGGGVQSWCVSVHSVKCAYTWLVVIFFNCSPRSSLAALESIVGLLCFTRWPLGRKGFSTTRSKEATRHGTTTAGARG
jgi:hypothetical protein